MGKDEVVLLHDLLGRRVITESGEKLGRVREFRAERVGEALGVTRLLVGPQGWLVAFGMDRLTNCREVDCRHVVEWGNPIRVSHKGRTV